MSTSYSYAQHPHQELMLDEPVFYGGMGERFAAILIDGLILLVPSLLVRFLLPVGGSVINIVMTWLYAALLESGEGQATVGKRAMGLKVTDVDGSQVSFAQASGRHFGKCISTLLLLIGYLMMLWSDRKQTLHDQMAGCVVVKV